MGNWCYGEKQYSETADITFAVYSPKTASRAKSRKRVLSPDKKQKMRKSKSQKQVRFRMSEKYTKIEPQTAGIVPKKIRKSGSAMQYESTECNTGVFAESPTRDNQNKQAILKEYRRNNLLAEVQGCKWRAIERDDKVLEFKARLKDYRAFIQYQLVLDGFVLNCARFINIDEDVVHMNKTRFYVVNATQQGK